MNNVIYQGLSINSVGTDNRSTLKTKPVTVAEAIISDNLDKEGRVRLPIVASNIKAVLTEIDTGILSKEYLEGMAYMAIIGNLPNGKKVKIDLDLFVKNGLLFHVLRDQGVDVVMTEQDDYGKSYIDTKATAEKSGGDYQFQSP